MKQVIAIAAVASVLTVGAAAPARADMEATAYKMMIYMDMLLDNAMEGNHAVTADPRGLSYEAYMNREGEAANGMIRHFMHLNDSASAGQIDSLDEAVRAHLVNAAETWMAYNPDKVGEMAATDWVTLEDLKSDPGLSADEVEAMVERGLAGYLEHNPGQ